MIRTNSYMAEIPYILAQLNIMDTRINHNNNNNNDLDITNPDGADTEPFDDYEDERHNFRRSADDRALAPLVSSLENSLVEHVQGSVPSLDELVIRQRGRKRQPAKISWSPAKTPFKTPTKQCSSLHMSLMSPSPKKLFNSSSTTSMKLRSSPRKRILVDTPTNDPNPSSSSTPLSTPTKRLKFFDDRSMNANNKGVPVRTLLKGLSQEQLIKIICDMSVKNPSFEEGVRQNLPLPDIRSFEDQLCSLRKNITRNSPRSRLLSKTDGAAFSRAKTHLTDFKKSIYNHCKILHDSQHFDAAIDYILMAWTYVSALPVWDETSHNILRRECFKILTLHAKLALRNGGMKLGSDRIANFRSKFKSMAGDFEDINKCQEALTFLANN